MKLILDKRLPCWSQQDEDCFNELIMYERHDAISSSASTDNTTKFIDSET